MATPRKMVIPEYVKQIPLKPSSDIHSMVYCLDLTKPKSQLAKCQSKDFILSFKIYLLNFYRCLSKALDINRRLKEEQQNNKMLLHDPV